MIGGVDTTAAVPERGREGPVDVITCPGALAATTARHKSTTVNGWETGKGWRGTRFG